MSLPEVLLWRELRRGSNGVRFRRQHPSGSYVLGFYCIDARLAIEVDGAAHGTDDRRRRDAVRDALLADAGIETLRVRAAGVLADPCAVAGSILRLAVARLTLPRPAARSGPPPRGELGEGR